MSATQPSEKCKLNNRRLEVGGFDKRLEVSVSA